MIEGIDAITYSTDRWVDAKKFFADWGLKLEKETPERMDWSTLNGCGVSVIRPDDANYPKAIEEGPTIREVVWGVDNAADLDTLAGPLSKAPGFVDGRATDGTLTARDPHGLQIQFRVMQKRPLEIKGAATNPWGDVRRVDSPSPIYDRAEPIEVGHVVLFTDRLAEAVAFYETLGFVQSDRYPDRGVFMRCAANAGHHDLFLLQLPGKAAGLNHVAYTVRDIHEVFGGGLHISRCGWKTQLGPGRHPISSAYFWYFENPCGGLIEYNADEDHLTPAW
ncbi:MAG: glyoxalase, partial [Rubrivivax sp.]